MTFKSKYDIGSRFIFSGCPCIITAVEFNSGFEETYTLQWVNPFVNNNTRMTKTELDNSILINEFMLEQNGKDNADKEHLTAYDRVFTEWMNYNVKTKTSDDKENRKDVDKEGKYNGGK